MSKRIDFTAPLSAEDAEWAAQFHGMHGAMLEAHREQFPPEPVAADLSGEDVETEPYTEWAKDDLVAETKRRNVEEGTHLKVTGTVAELAKQLEEDDTARAE